jgi:hypothetical protein
LHSRQRLINPTRIRTNTGPQQAHRTRRLARRHPAQGHS